MFGGERRHDRTCGICDVPQLSGESLGLLTLQNKLEIEIRKLVGLSGCERAADDHADDAVASRRRSAYGLQVRPMQRKPVDAGR